MSMCRPVAQAFALDEPFRMSRESDARRLLGIGENADAEAVRAARRHLAKAIHPDVDGGSAGAMQELNEAADTVLGALAGRATTTPSGPDSAPTPPAPMPTAPTNRRPPSGASVDHDVASFVIEALPAEAFEALVVVTSWIGEVIVDEPPYQLDVLLTDPLRCWCRLDLIPDAGASTVSVTIGRLPDEPLPDIDDVRDLWVASLNRLGAPE